MGKVKTLQRAIVNSTLVKLKKECLDQKKIIANTFAERIRVDINSKSVYLENAILEAFSIVKSMAEKESPELDSMYGDPVVDKVIERYLELLEDETTALLSTIVKIDSYLSNSEKLMSEEDDLPY